MRIISGKFGSRRFNYKLPNGIRPTTDMARESIFNILDNMIDYNGLKVLDLFAGSGSIGIEFLSRGAEFVHFNDKNSQSINYIKKIIDELGVSNYSSSKISALNYLKTNNINSESKIFDIIYIDPPYESNEYQAILDLIKESKFIENGGLVLVESNLVKKYDFGYNILKEKKFSSFIIRLFGN
jgi:16S rRNA (guanine(966)-N(2))-methyltransferase RsmD